MELDFNDAEPRAKLIKHLKKHLNKVPDQFKPWDILLLGKLEDRDAFIPPKPFDSWVLNETSCLWEAPVAYPDDGQQYTWNEETTNWDLVTL